MVERLNGIQEVGSSNLLPSTKSLGGVPPKRRFFVVRALSPPILSPFKEGASPMILAYIDPGSGSILIQVILASCIGGVAVFWQKIKALFSGKKPDAAAKPDEPKKPE